METVLRRHHARRSLDQTQARVLADLIAGRLDRTRLSNPTRVALASLRNAGLVDLNDEPAVSDDVAYSLLIEA